MTHEPDCIFCGIVAGDLPSTTIAQTDRAIAFMDINPVTLGHALVIPRAHATDLFDTPADGLPWTSVPSTPDEIQRIGRLLS